MTTIQSKSQTDRVDHVTTHTGTLCTWLLRNRNSVCNGSGGQYFGLKYMLRQNTSTSHRDVISCHNGHTRTPTQNFNTFMHTSVPMGIGAKRGLTGASTQSLARAAMADARLTARSSCHPSSPTPSTAFTTWV
jgi:hypothetical protein